MRLENKLRQEQSQRTSAKNSVQKVPPRQGTVLVSPRNRSRNCLDYAGNHGSTFPLQDSRSTTCVVSGLKGRMENGKCYHRMKNFLGPRLCFERKQQIHGGTELPRGPCLLVISSFRNEAKYLHRICCSASVTILDGGCRPASRKQPRRRRTNWNSYENCSTFLQIDRASTPAVRIQKV